MHSSTLVILLITSFLGCVLADGDVYTLTYTADNFDDEVVKHNHFVMFYAPWCGYCKKLHPTWEELAEMLNQDESNVKIAKVDCTQHGELCNSHEVTGYPTLKFFTIGSNEGVKYRGTRDLPSLTNFINEQTLGSTADVKIPEAAGLIELTEDNFEKHIATGKHFIKFYAPWCGHCQKLAPIWDQLAKDMVSIDNVKIAKVDCTQHRSACSPFDIKGYPTLLWIEDGRKVEKYALPRTIADLSKYVIKMSGSTQSEEKPEQPKPSEQEDSSNVVTLSGENFDEGIATGVTFVKFFAPWCGHCKRMAPTWEELGKKFIGNPHVDIVKIDCTLEVNKELCNTQEVNGFPSVILYKDGRRISEYNGNRSLQDLYEFIHQHLEPHDEL